MASDLQLLSPDAMPFAPRSPTTSNLESAATPPCKWATKEDWVTKQALIAQLYETQPLPKVMHLMETHYSFKATNKMYKTRMKQWRLNKKGQKHEIEVVAHPDKRQCVTLGRRSAIRRPGRQIDVRDLIRAQMYNAVPTLLTTPGLLGISEHIFKTTRDYYRGSFESGMWVSDQTETGDHCGTVKAGPQGPSIEDPSRYLYALLDQCTLACRLFARKLYKEGGQALISATARIKDIVQAEDPTTLSILFGLVLEVRRNNRQEVALAVLRQFSAFAEMLLGDQHPLRQVCGWLTSIVTTCFDEVVVRCLRNASECLENSLGPMHRSALYSRLTYTAEAYRHEVNNHGEMLQRNLLYKCERVLGAHDVRTLQTRLCLAKRCVERESYLEAGKLGHEIVAYSRQAPSRFYQYYLRTSGLYIQATVQYNLHEVEPAEANLREAIAQRQLVWGTHDIQARDWLVVLEEWLSKQGHLSPASQVKAGRKVIHGPVYRD